MRKYIIPIIIFITTLVLFFWMLSMASAAQPTPYKIICHHNGSQEVTLSFQNEQSYSGHLGSPHSSQVFDTDGACAQPTPTDEVTPTPTDTPNPCEGNLNASLDAVVEVCVTPTIPEPSVTPTSPPTVQVEEQHNAGSSATTPSCGDSVPGVVANINVLVGTPNDGKLTVQWSLPEGADKVHIRFAQYGQQGWPYSLLNTENDGHEEIGGLTNGVNYRFEVAGVNGCSVGNWSNSFDPMP